MTFYQSEKKPPGIPQPATASVERAIVEVNKRPTALLRGLRSLRWIVLAALIFHLSGCSWMGMIKPSSRDTFSTVDWKPCLDNPKFLCGTLDVPTDYFNTSFGTTTLALSKSPSTCHPSKKIGSLFINPGGPGGSGRDFLFRLNWAEFLKGRYDIIGFDPRGIGRTTPRVDCFPSAAAYAEFKKSTVLSEGLNVPSKGNVTWESLLEQHKELLALKEAEFKLCDETMGEELDYMGTSTVVRDIERMAEVLDGPDAPIHFFGGSYGTIVGAYLVNMLPHKTGRVLIDGVASSPEWANERADLMLYNWLDSTEDTFAWFLRDCASAGPDACALALKTDKDPAGSEIEARLMAYVEELYVRPVGIAGADQPGVLYSGSARAILYQSTNAPHSWPATAELFAQAMYHSNPLPLYLAGHRPSPLDGKPGPDGYILSGQSDLSRAAVGCADEPSTGRRKDGPTAEEMSRQAVKVLKERSSHFGASVSTIEPDGGCEFWRAPAPHPEGFRFTGPWNATLRTPMMIVSNTADPITPLSSGREINKLMGNSSRLLIQNSPGHCSMGSISLCTLRNVQAYFVDGALPENEHLCSLDDTYFPKPNSTVVEALSEEDQALMRVGRENVQAWTEFVLGSRD